MKPHQLSSILTISLLFIGLCTQAQKANIQAKKTPLKTYAFDDPDPVPILVSNPKIYPYFTYEGYAHDSRQQNWNVVHLENEHVEVWVLPEAGGKVWGAREKTTGEEFIYRNEVMKFRNIAMRGPWTSGGIEFNFGIIGHHPSTASPVDYALVEEEDGSVSCWVGNIDLPSRTEWRVKVNLPKDKAYFETQALWYNPTPMHQSYYNWMTGAAFASNDLEFYCPGNQYLEHGGDPRPWPNEYGRNIAAYRENNFLSHKSYHVVGEYNDFFGGYYQNQGYGFGHWSPYDEMPGQKLWLWSLAQNGGIWEELLTDTDGQYIEFQAGRLFNQYSPGGGYNPVTQAVFPPHTTDRWREVWFPVKEIGGLTDVSTTAVLHLSQKDGQLIIGINALETASGTLRVISDEEILLEKPVKLDPMDVITEKIAWPQSDRPFQVSVEGMGLHYDSDPAKLALKRPFDKPAISGIPQAETHFRAGIESMEYREYNKAEKSLKACLQENPAHLEALAALGELYYRQGRYNLGLKKALFALSIDTYHPYANYVAGLLFQAKGDIINAKEMLGWAARSMTYRSAAYSIMGELSLLEQKPQEAIRYAEQALDYNRFNINAHKISAIAHRINGDRTVAGEWVEKLLQLDPLSHFARFEKYLLQKDEAAKKEFISNIRNEIPYQSYLEIGVTYHNLGQDETAYLVLDLAPQQALISIWKAYLKKDKRQLAAALSQSPDFVFPFRRESLKVMEWAARQSDDWKADYYLALNYWGKGRMNQAEKLLENIESRADYAPFYLARAQVREKSKPEAALQDLQKALSLDSQNWRSLHQLVLHHQNHKHHQEGLKVSKQAYTLHPESYTAGMDYVKSLIFTDQYQPALAVLKKLRVLPYEGASASRQLYEWAHLGRAIEQIKAKQFKDAILTLTLFKEWPERLGVGRPFHPDERLADFLLAHAYWETGQKDQAAAARQRIVDFTRNFPFQNSANALLGYQLMSDGEVTDLMINVYQNKGELPDQIQWALAQVKGEKTKVEAILSKNQNSFQGKGFGFLKQALALSGK